MHVTTQWDRRDEVMRFGIPCTGVDRTILDCAEVSPVRHVELLAERAIRNGLKSWSEPAQHAGRAFPPRA